MPIFQVVKVRVLQSVVFIQAPDMEHAESWAKKSNLTKEIETDNAAEIIWNWDDDDEEAPIPINPMEDMNYHAPD